MLYSSLSRLRHEFGDLYKTMEMLQTYLLLFPSRSSAPVCQVHSCLLTICFSCHWYALLSMLFFLPKMPSPNLLLLDQRLVSKKSFVISLSPFLNDFSLQSLFHHTFICISLYCVLMIVQDYVLSPQLDLEHLQDKPRSRLFKSFVSSIGPIRVLGK